VQEPNLNALQRFQKQSGEKAIVPRMMHPPVRCAEALRRLQGAGREKMAYFIIGKF